MRTVERDLATEGGGRVAVRRHVPFALLAAVAAASVVWLTLPREREVGSVWELLAKLVPFVLAAEAIARMDTDLVRRRWLARIASAAAFLVFFCWVVPKIFYYNEQFDRLYYYVLTLTPFVILSLALAYRLGGGAPGEVRRVAYACLLLMLSGVEDLAFLVLSPHTDPRSGRSRGLDVGLAHDRVPQPPADQGGGLRLHRGAPGPGRSGVVPAG